MYLSQIARLRIEEKRESNLDVIEYVLEKWENRDEAETERRERSDGDGAETERRERKEWRCN